MRVRLFPATVRVWSVIGLALLSAATLRAQAADMKFRSFLMWGTDAGKPPAGKEYKPADPEIAKELSKLPLKWTNWFEVNRKDFSVPKAPAKKVALSEKCELEVKNLGDSNIEVALIGKGKEVVRRKQSLEAGQILNLGGNAPNATAWLVVLKRLE